MLQKKSEPTHNRSSLRKWINSCVQDTYNHHACFLPGQVGIFSPAILNLYFSGIKINREQLDIIRQIPEKAVVVYVNKLHSHFEYLFSYSRFNDEGLPFPEIGFDYKTITWQSVSRLFKIFIFKTAYIIKNFSLPDPYESGYIKNELLNGRTGMLSLVRKKGFYQRFVKEKTDPLQYLLEMQESMNRPIIIVPQLMFFSKNAQRSVPTFLDIIFGTEQKPGRIRRTVNLLKNRGKIFAEISQPINLKKFIIQTDIKEKNIRLRALILRRNLLFQLNHHRRSITGPVLKSREELRESILTNDRLRLFMENYSQKRNVPLKTIHKQANSYLDEIAATYNTGFIRIASSIVSWFLNSMFDGVAIDRDGLSKVKKMSQRGPLILIPCHKSHIDYLILPYILSNYDMPCPHGVAGKNLFFWPLGWILRRGGAFSIRRSFGGAVFYTKVFSEYIYMLLKEGFNLELFFEGGRSRTGKLIAPKLGFLSILLNAYKAGACDDMIFAPIYIGYDRVPEEDSYLNEIKGGEKKPENL